MWCGGAAGVLRGAGHEVERVEVGGGHSQGQSPHLRLQGGLRIRIRMDPHTNCGSGSRRAKMTHKNRRKHRILMF